MCSYEEKKLGKGGSKSYTIVYKWVCSCMIQQGGEKVVPSLCMYAYTAKSGDHSIKFKIFPKKERKHGDSSLKVISLGF